MLSTIASVVDVEGEVRRAGFPPGEEPGGVAVAPNGGAADPVFLGVASLGWTRNDVAAAYPADGPNHGFAVLLRMAAGQHTLCAYAVNAAAPWDKPRPLGRLIAARVGELPGEWPVVPVPTRSGWRAQAGRPTWAALSGTWARNCWLVPLAAAAWLPRAALWHKVW